MSSELSESSSSGSPIVGSDRRLAYNRYSSDKKNILIKCYRDGKTISESAEIAGINKNSAKCIINRYKKNGEVLIEKKRGGKRSVKLTPIILNKIEEIIEENPSITLKNIREKILESEHVQLSITSVSVALKRLRITLKCASRQTDRRNSQNTIEQRKKYALHFSRNSPEDRQKIIFVDESGFNYHLRRAKARSKVNTPAPVIVPSVRGRNVSLIAAINVQGTVFHQIIAHSSVNSNIFCQFLRGLFLKLEEDHTENAWLILDNVSVHKTQEVHDLVGQTTHRLIFLPPYSPMLNPIEEVFSKVKMCARNILADPTNRSTLVDVIEHSIASITSTDCYNYVMHMYRQFPSAAAGEKL